MENIFSWILPLAITLFVIIILSCGYVKAPPDMAFLISGLRKKPRILIGRASVKIPFLERLDKLSLGAANKINKVYEWSFNSFF